jgi:hypothetical protein
MNKLCRSAVVSAFLNDTPPALLFVATASAAVQLWAADFSALFR